MRTHPVFLRLDGRRCVVVGGDEGAAAKARACAEAGARVTVVAPPPAPAITSLVAAGLIVHEPRAWRAGDLAGAALAYAATDDPALIAALVAEAERERVLLNVPDRPEACSFFSPAVVARGDLRIAIGTGGASPGLAARLRRTIEADVGPEYAAFVAILAGVRATLAGAPERADLLGALLDSPLLALLREDRHGEIDELLARIVGPDVSLARLGVVLARGAA
jgi:precorrin-2 dehydrogenase/sirohydrochlorin ferrochelatase